MSRAERAPRIAAWYTSSFTIGASLSFLFGRVGTLLGWCSAFVIAGILGAAGLFIAWVALPRGDSGPGGVCQIARLFRRGHSNETATLLLRWT
jgi:predicted MFS family arabinose efflux permease